MVHKNGTQGGVYKKRGRGGAAGRSERRTSGVVDSQLKEELPEALK